MPLNSKIEQVLDMIARAKRPQLHESSPQQARASYEKSAPILEIASAPMFSVEDLQVPTRDGATIRARLYQPVEPSWAEPAPALVYYHGGGFTVGSVDTHDALCRMFARDGRCTVLSVDYRLAPEYKFPTAVDDAFDALTWLHAHAAEYGVDAKRLAVGGDSAGGTLATVCAVLARDVGIKLALQLLIYPGTTGYQQTDSHSRLADGFLLSGDTIQWFFELYVRDKNDRDDWRFAPLDGTRGAPDFSGLAPAWIATAEYDPLSDEGDAYAEKLRAAGNQVTLKRYPGMIHEFFKMGGFVPDVAQAHQDAAAVLRAAFGVE
ncbi:Carboxylesterase NlhH [Paraburkholderia domus]|uniref:Carboxylesterase NlhH n=1 Tax=Paraburkholderia domus TaxID=2793075 RepID=A0A9N8N834_9BURK|nr:alpha/beta hydrolase [Paraburkholderia domus]MBK5051939.1 alpha/beta hydrolase [Burkholderia sp. R-70006]MBK5063819.1 alpha/beta hydrolase [Burkholderia sp. R-70199]MBK5088811.1 alpha/beta hydrolase [Burkholderia sp. R-69927]MBK5122318.1 alpha/beta hydrolase [Burkholderia sp. R-69980]MBK5167794.1 alpha/beta hydrolase [Burkholderia sp. R-70211]MBK5182898.1 alpha/beta hydrolase [Burkholderia sp. R-69749]MCI0149075.1 alpha/beta hydrolase fold domain-containing protein [Paraburkholderia sedim